MKNDNKDISTTANTTNIETTEYKGKDWGLYIILLFSFAVLIAMLVTSYIDHN